MPARRAWRAPACRRGRARGRRSGPSSGPPNGWRSTTSSAAPSAMPCSSSQRSISDRRPRRGRSAPARRRQRLEACVSPSSITSSAAGIGSPWGSCVGLPSFAAMRASRSSEITCSSASASSWTRSHGTPRCSARYSSSRRWWRSTSSATRSPPVGQLDALVGHVLDEPALGELLDHRRGRGGRHAEALGQRVGRDRRRRRGAERVDRLRVVLDRVRVAPRARRAIRRHQQAGGEHERHPGQQARRRRAGAAGGPRRRAGSGASWTITWTIAPAPKPNRKAARLELNAAAPIQAPSTAGAPAISPSATSRPQRRLRLGERRDDGQALGRVVQREADDEEGAERQRADGVRRADGDALAEVVQPDADGDEQREVARPRRPAPRPRATRRTPVSAR